MSCGVGCSHSSDPEWLWLWYRPAAVALIGPLAWEPPDAHRCGPKKPKKKKKRKRKKETTFFYKKDGTF